MANLKQKLFARKIDSAFILNIQMGMKYTPDIAYLQQFERQLLFVPDNYMMGHIDQDRLVQEELIFPTAFTSDLYSMVYKPLGIESYPIVLETNKREEDNKRWADPNRPTKRLKQARVRGQTYAVVPNQFLVLDKDKENGIVFERKRVLIDVPVRCIQDGSTVYRVSDADHQLFTKRHEGGKDYFTIPSGGSALRIYSMKMWMYVGKPDYWKEMLDSKDIYGRGYELPAVRILRPRNPLLKDYFYWLKNEDRT
jgi:hypothetical protein